LFSAPVRWNLLNERNQLNLFSPCWENIWSPFNELSGCLFLIYFSWRESAWIVLWIFKVIWKTYVNKNDDLFFTSLYSGRIVNFQNLMKIKFCWRLIFEILIIHKPWGHVRSPKKFGPDRFSRFDYKHVNKQTDKQRIYI